MTIKYKFIMTYDYKSIMQIRTRAIPTSPARLRT